ncbi:MAG: hypothetical protein CL484_08465 [Acidobacteria bacterium]|nr:hypothetical protein [Acidobacteriota bacterium]|tara:strand:+ start:7004 stop:7387 length:384 start_codon:yes stop_codon:yes gene_type:complete
MSLKDQLKLEDQINSFELKITSMTSSASGVQVNASGTVQRYGKVFLTYNFQNNPTQQETGSFTGFGWGVTEEGVRNQGERRGVFVSNGLTGTVYSLDDVSDGNPNFCIERWDLTNETITLQFSRIQN